ncbi:hypothetical protein [Martelella alba]|uniref:hypothetical protein n=1 Tax=Martelella alba TaxID=2590451 RepID=UPI001484DEBF|nr:hypothetical protein [Martelella alba]
MALVAFAPPMAVMVTDQHKAMGCFAIDAGCDITDPLTKTVFDRNRHRRAGGRRTLS